MFELSRRNDFLTGRHHADVQPVNADYSVPLLKAMKRIKADLRYEYKMMSGIAIRKPADKTIEETMAYFKKVKGVVSVMRDGVNYLH